MVKRFLIALWMFAPLAVAAQGPVPSVPVNVSQQSIPVSPDLLDDWAKLFLAGDWPGLQSSVKRTLDPADFKRAAGDDLRNAAHEFAFDQHYYRILFLSTVRRPEGEIIQFLVHDPSLPLYGTRLPGVRQLYDVFLSTVPDASLKSSYLSTQQPDPLLEKIPAFFKMFDLSQIAEFGFAQLGAPLDKATATLYIHVSRVDLPFERASVVISDEASLTPPLDSAKMAEKSANLQRDLGLRGARGSLCATRLASCLNEIVRAGLGEPPTDRTCPPARPVTDAELPECPSGSSPAAIQCRITERMKNAYADVMATEADCAPGAGKDFRPVIEVEEAFKSFVATGTKTLQAKKDTTYENAPLERLSLGALATLMVDTSGDTRVKTDAGKLVSDPLRGTLTAAVVNFHPWAFDPKSLEITPGERFRLFGGVAISPDFGLVGGVGYALWRGVTVNLGGGLLRVNTLKRGDALDQAAKNPEDPFKDGLAEVVFVGFGYNL